MDVQNLFIFDLKNNFSDQSLTFYFCISYYGPQPPINFIFLEIPELDKYYGNFLVFFGHPSGILF